MSYVRTATRSDEPAIRDLAARMGSGSAFDDLRAYFDEDTFTFLDANPSTSAVADDAGVIVGFLGADAAPDHLWIHWLLVDPLHAGEGVGRDLMVWGMNHAPGSVLQGYVHLKTVNFISGLGGVRGRQVVNDDGLSLVTMSIGKRVV